MTYKFTIITAIIAVIVSGVCYGAEIRLKSLPVRCDSTVVTVQDVADLEFTNRESQTLRTAILETVLFPAPQPGDKRVVSLSEVRDYLAARGISSLEHRITGASQVIILGGENPSVQIKRDMAAVNVKPLQQKEIDGQVIAAIEFHLNRQTNRKNVIASGVNTGTGTTNSANTPVWDIQVELSPAQTKTLAVSGRILNIYGGTAPWVGKQQFDLELEGIDPQTNRRVIVSVAAAVNLPPEVVVLKRAVVRGKIMSAADLEMVRRNDVRGTDFFTNPQDVIGKEAVGNIREGVILSSAMVSSPILVQKRKPVTVIVKAPGVRISDVGMAIQDGVLGDLVTVERLDNKKESFVAKVVGHGTVELLASGP